MKSMGGDIWLCVGIGLFTMLAHAASFYAGYFNLPAILSNSREEAFDKDFYVRPAATVFWIICYAIFIIRIARHEARWQGLRNTLAFVAAFVGVIGTFTFFERGAEAGHVGQLKASGNVMEIEKPSASAALKKIPGYLTVNGGTIDNPNALSGEYRTASTGGTASRPGSGSSPVPFTLLPIIDDAENEAEMVRIFLFMDYGKVDSGKAYTHRVRGYVRKFKHNAKREFETLEETFDGEWQRRDSGIAKTLTDYSGSLPETVLVLDNSLLQDGGQAGLKPLTKRLGIIAILTLLLVLLQTYTRKSKGGLEGAKMSAKTEA